MEQTLTAKLKILPDPADKQLLIDTMRAYSAACDFVSSHVFLFRDLSIASLNRDLYRSIREKFGLRSTADLPASQNTTNRHSRQERRNRSRCIPQDASAHFYRFAHTGLRLKVDIVSF